MSSNTQGLLRCIEDLYIPTRAPIGKASPPRFVFEPITRRQRLLLDELDLRARKLLAALADAEEQHAQRYPGSLPSGPERQAMLLAALKERHDDPSFARWWSDLQTLRRGYDAQAEQIAAERAAVVVAQLEGDWSLVVADWTTTPSWPVLVRTGDAQVGLRVELLDQMPDEVTRALERHVRDGLSGGAARLDEAERGN